MITALHTLVYADDPEAARTFFRDVLEFPGVDTGGGWLIFKTGPSELGVHPRSWESGLTAKGAEFAGEVSDQGWGRTIRLKVPGFGEMTLYEPKYDPPATS